MDLIVLMLLCWATPTQTDDGSALERDDIAGFRIFEVVNAEPRFVTTVAGDVNCITVPDGCYAIKTRDTAGVDSVEFSQMACKEQGCHRGEE